MRRMVLVLAMVAVVSGGRPGGVAGQMEVEADPIAYALNGFSLHVAGVLGSARVSVGAYGLDVPDWLHGNDGWAMSFRGAGMKLDYLGSRVDGFFAGVDGGFTRVWFSVESGGEEKRNQFGVGLRGGYRLDIGRSGLYLAPWVGVGYTFGGGDIVLGEERFEHKPLTIFPTVHIGWRF
jgi:hypothetical protein